MKSEPSIRLDRLAAEMRVPMPTAVGWVPLLDGYQNLGRGRGRGIILSRSAAVEFCAVALLRARFVPMSDVRDLVATLRAQGKHGAAFLKAGVGAHGRAALDGRGPTAPLFELTGQGVLFPKLDLREIEGRIGAVLDGLEAERTSS